MQGDGLSGTAYVVDNNNCRVGNTFQMLNDNGWLRAGGIFTALYGYPNGYPVGQKYLLDIKNSAAFALTISAMWSLY